jgi:hypothetical protein
MSQNQIDAALTHFELTAKTFDITSKAEYLAERETYARMEASLLPDELFSSVARYILSLGMRLAEWERKSKVNAFGRGRK